MENNEIYIDGVDVAGCKLYDYGICDSEMAEDLNCEKNPDCYYKQLVYQVKENEALKYIIDKLKQENKDLKDELNKTIKEYNYFNKACVEANTKNIELQRENEILKKKLDIAVGRSTTHGEAAEKYWAALEEIKEIVNHM